MLHLYQEETGLESLCSQAQQWLVVRWHSFDSSAYQAALECQPIDAPIDDG